MRLLFYPPPNPSKKLEVFFLTGFIFTAEFIHFLVTKKTVFFVTKKWLNSTVKINSFRKKTSNFWGVFEVLGRDKKKYAHIYSLKFMEYLFSFERFKPCLSFLFILLKKVLWEEKHILCFFLYPKKIIVPDFIIVFINNNEKKLGKKRDLSTLSQN